MELKFRQLEKDEIEVRPTDTKSKGSCTLLLYMDSRAAVTVLNEAVGPFNWQIEYHDTCDGKLYGRLSIWDEEKNMWVAKEDTGEESNIDARKGEASDILKRCLVRWGFSALYTAPRIKIKCPDKYYFNDKMTMTFSVSKIKYDNGKIVELEIVDRFLNVVYDWVRDDPEGDEVDNLTLLKRFCRVKDDNGEDRDKVLKFYQYYAPKANGFKTFQPDLLYSKWKS